MKREYCHCGAPTRPSKDHDTRPTVRIEVLPLEDIDPQQQRISTLEALLRDAYEVLPDDDTGNAVAYRIRRTITDTNDTNSQGQP